MIRDHDPIAAAADFFDGFNGRFDLLLNLVGTLVAGEEGQFRDLEAEQGPARFADQGLVDNGDAAALDRRDERRAFTIEAGEPLGIILDCAASLDLADQRGNRGRRLVGCDRGG